MNLTNNEKRALKLMLENPKISDSAMASTLKISSQAVGKIRKKLEKTVIDSYSLNLNYEALGIKAFALGLAKVTSEGKEIGYENIEQKLLDDPHIIQVFRMSHGQAQYAILYGFRDINELDFFFHSPHKKKEFHSFIETIELYPFSHNSLIKSSSSKLFTKMIDGLGIESAEIGFQEINRIKNGLKF
jgi:DNA-binding Lrp family transcriptional regulator